MNWLGKIKPKNWLISGYWQQCSDIAMHSCWTLCIWHGRMYTYHLKSPIWKQFLTFQPLKFPDVPWRTCDNYWNTETCVNPYDRTNLTCWSVMDKTTFCTLNGKNVSKVMLSDPVKEFWEWVFYKSIYFL